MTQFLQKTVFPILEESISGDAALVNHTAFTIDSFVAEPPFFPGGSIGTLAVSGTVNDLVAAGAKPSALALSLILEKVWTWKWYEESCRIPRRQRSWHK